jgi:alkylhydroperoxidase family enzyme
LLRLSAIEPEKATGNVKDLLDAVQAKLSLTPNMTRVMANSPAVLEAYLSFSGALAGGSLNSKLREQIALEVAQQNSCQYCVSGHNNTADVEVDFPKIALRRSA